MLSEFCSAHLVEARRTDTLLLQNSAKVFLNSLNLPIIHPHCVQDETVESSTHSSLVGSSQGICSIDECADNTSFDENIWSQMLTSWYQVAPAILAMTELWIRLIAFYVGPLSIVMLMIMKHFRNRESQLIMHNRHKWCDFCYGWVSFFGAVSCMVLLTDSQYVFIYGRFYGAITFTMILILSLEGNRHMKFYKYRTILSLITIVVVTIYLLSQSHPSQTGIYDHPGIDIPSIQEGIYYAKDNPIISSIIHNWPKASRTYSIRYGATPYLPTGDSLTGIPFLVNRSPEVVYFRRWVLNPHDGEAVAIDIAFSPDGTHNVQKPLYLILHGLSGGSHEEYVREFVSRRTNEGSTCVVMIARGLMDTPVKGWNVFHGARISDFEAVTNILRKAVIPGQVLAGVGYSMGAIILSNYIARSGIYCNLDAAMAVSGGLDMRENLNFRRSMRLWQPMLAQALRDDFIKNKFDPLFRQRLDRVLYSRLMRESSITGIDLYGIVHYNGYDDLLNYYSDMSAMGDNAAFRSHNQTYATDFVGRIENVSIPFCVLHSLDDPLVTWRVMGHNPQALANSGSGNVIVLLTKTGGHVGWPIGWNPKKNGWKWMNNAIRDFIDSVIKVRQESGLN